MTDSSTIVRLSEDFIQAYTRQIRYLASSFSHRDWGFLPNYWFHPIKIEIAHTLTDDIAIKFGDVAKSRADLIKIVHVNARIEESQFPHLDYGKWPFFKIRNGTHHSQVSGGTLSVGKHPVVILGQGVDFKIMDVRVEANEKGYPRQRSFIWFFTVPNSERLKNVDRAVEEATNDFWSRLSSVILTRADDILSKSLASKTVALFIQSLERLQKEYHELITLNEVEEQRLQNFLENHYFLLDPKKNFTKEKRSIGDYKADFVLRYDDGHLALVEIQLNHDPIMEKNQPSKGFKEALRQIDEWFSWLENNEPFTFINSTGLIVIGRRNSYQKNNAEIDMKLACFKRPVMLLTYDDLERAFDLVKGYLEKSPN